MTLVTIKEWVQNLLAIPWVRTCHLRATYILLRLVSCSRLLSAFFSSFLTGSFLREQHAVLKGRAAYFKNSLSKDDVNWTLLRRNTHRLEKGLILRPRKEVFALNYIEETVDEFLNIKPDQNHSTTKWSHDVLHAYFNAITHTPATERLHQKFNGHSTSFRFSPLSKDLPPRTSQEEQLSPYNREEKTEISFDDFMKLSMIRRSVRYFENSPVSRALLDQAFLAASQSPSACNRQPFRYIIFDQADEAAEVASIPFGTLGYGDRVPCLIVLVGSLAHYPSPRDRHVIYIDGALSAMSFMYALETLGLSSCPINWPDFGPLERKMAKRLSLEPYERPIMLMAVGYPDRTAAVAYSNKKSLPEIREYASDQ